MRCVKKYKKGGNVSLKIGKHKSRSGGLTKAGRDKYNRETGSNLQAPQPGGGPRKKSFCARFRGMKGPMTISYRLVSLSLRRTTQSLKRMYAR